MALPLGDFGEDEVLLDDDELLATLAGPDPFAGWD